MAAFVSQGVAGTESAGEAGFELSLSIWDAVLLGHVSATRPGLRGRASHVAPNSPAPVAHRKEAA